MKVACRLSGRNSPPRRRYYVPSILSPLTNHKNIQMKKTPSPSEISELSRNLLHKAPKNNQSPTDAPRNASRYNATSDRPTNLQHFSLRAPIHLNRRLGGVAALVAVNEYSSHAKHGEMEVRCSACHWIFPKICWIDNWKDTWSPESMEELKNLACAFE